MELTLSDLAAQLGLELRGRDRTINGLNTLENAGPQEVSFLANPKYVEMLSSTRAGAIIVGADHADKVETALVSANPYLDFARAVQLFARPQGCLSGVSEQAYVHDEAELGEGCDVYPFAFIGARASLGKGCRIFPGAYVGEDCVLGDGCIVFPNASLMAGTRLGDRCIIHAGCVLGSDGFGFAPTPAGMQKIPQIGTVAVGSDVEIGANAAIDRAVLEATRIGDGTKIDNLVQIGHNVEMGANCIIVSQVGISGSTKVGERVTMAGQVGVAGHLHIGDGATLGPKTGVPKDVPAGATMGGIPAVDKSTYMRTLALMPTFPDMARKLKKMEKELAALKAQVQGTTDSE